MWNPFVVWCALAGLLPMAAPPSGVGQAAALDAEGCVDRALGHSAQVEHARAQLWQYEARLRQVEANQYPRLTATSLLAPAYTVRGSGFDPNVSIRYKSIRDWGPFTNVEARVVQGLYSFGRFDASREAARERMLVERGRVREVEQTLAREVRKLYYTHLYVETMRPALEQAQAFVETAIARADALSRAGSGEVHQSDLGRLVHGQSELLRRIDEADEARALSLAALLALMGVDDGAPLMLKDARLPMPPAVLDIEGACAGPAAGVGAPVPLELSHSDRPEWEQLLHGQRAAVALERSERASTLPQLAIAGQFTAAWTPTRDRDRSPWHFDMYNRLAGGAALVLHLDLDIAGARARAQEAAMMGAQLRALQRYAAMGIPLEVRQASEGMARARKDLSASQADVVATRRWLTFAKAAMQSGTGDARDLLEGLVAHLQAKQAHASAALVWWQKLADVTHATGAARPAWPLSPAGPSVAG